MHFCGEIGELISDVVEEFGESSLFLDDKPKLKAEALKLMRDFREAQKGRARDSSNLVLKGTTR